MLKKLFKVLKIISNPLIQYLKKVLKLIIFRENIGLSISTWILIIYILFVIISVLINEQQEISLIFLVTVSIFVFLLFLGFIAFLILDFFPNLINGHIKIIRDKLNYQIFDWKQLGKYTYTNELEIKNIENLFDFKKIPDIRVIEIWLYKMKIQKNNYMIFAPLGYLLLSLLNFYIKEINYEWFSEIYLPVIQSSSSTLDLIKWFYIAFFVSTELIDINNDICKLEFLKNILSKRIENSSISYIKPDIRSKKVKKNK